MTTKTYNRGEKYLMETWRDIKDFPGYQVSNYGKIRSFINFKGRLVEEPHMVKWLFNSKTGYVFIHLSRDGKPYNRYVHRLVADAFCDNNHYGMEINHIDGNKLNNHCDNLEWCTRSENIKHAFDTGLKVASKANSIPIRVVETGEVFDSIKDCSRVVGPSKSKISQCLNSKHRRSSYNGYHFERIDKNNF